MSCTDLGTCFSTGCCRLMSTYATIWLLVAFPGNPGRTRGGASWVGIRVRKVPRGLRDTDWSIETESQSQKRSTQDKERRERPWETTCGLRGVDVLHKGVSGRDEPRGPRSRHERLTADGAARFPSLLVHQPQSIIILHSLHSFSPARSARPWGPIDRPAQVLQRQAKIPVPCCVRGVACVCLAGRWALWFDALDDSTGGCPRSVQHHRETTRDASRQPTRPASPQQPASAIPLFRCSCHTYPQVTSHPSSRNSTQGAAASLGRRSSSGINRHLRH